MRKFFFFLSVLLSGSAFAADAPLKVLMIGNSYSLSCKAYLPVVAASANCPLDLEIAYIGGCSLQRHVEEYEHSVKDGNHRPYGSFKKKAVSLPELLAQKKWDVITIQQASPLSWRADSYHPWAEKLIAVIRETNPQAEIIIQETWSYNGGDPRFARLDDKWSVDQTTMFEALDKNYRKLAAENGFRIIPTGVAVQLSRQDSPRQLPTCDAAFLHSLSDSDALPETLDVVGECNWGKGKNGKKAASADTIHLNDYGKYLQACVWFGVLFQKPVSEITFYPEKLDRERVEKLRRFAQRSLDLEKEYGKSQR
ncbi:MAG: DUF4886 domain-containing protein [Victivallaceae bacterium]|nr:DUF4886 domain-containing protein [Victivallaceae bacterium]